MHRRSFLSSGLALGSALALPDSVQGEPEGKTEQADLVIDGARTRRSWRGTEPPLGPHTTTRK